MVHERQDNLREALKRVAVALKDTGVPFALAGGYAVWARGGPEPEHDVDFLIQARESERVADLLRQAGLDVEQPPEDWLFKVRTDDAVVDLLFRVPAAPDKGEGTALASATEVEVLSVRMPVLAATDLMVQKLGVLSERFCDLGRVLPAARALREQVDWDRVRDETAGNPFAEAVLLLLERLRVLPVQ